MNICWTDLPGPQSSTSSQSAFQIFVQLNELYNKLQCYYPDWSRENPFLSLVSGRSDPELRETAVIWNQWIDHSQTQPTASVPVV
jgi:hypothetical protein